MGHPIQQGTNHALEDNNGHLAVQPMRESLQPSNPARGLPETATKISAMPDPVVTETHKSLKKSVHPKTVSETVVNPSSHVWITQSTASSNTPPGHSSMSTAGSQMGPDLSQIPSKELDSFIQDHLRPSSQFQQQVRQAIDTILCCLREKCVDKVLRVSKVSPKVKVPFGMPLGNHGGQGGSSTEPSLVRGTRCPRCGLLAGYRQTDAPWVKMQSHHILL